MFRELLGTEKYRFDEFFPIDFVDIFSLNLYQKKAKLHQKISFKIKDKKIFK